MEDEKSTTGRADIESQEGRGRSETKGGEKAKGEEKRKKSNLNESLSQSALDETNRDLHCQFLLNFISEMRIYLET